MSIRLGQGIRLGNGIEMAAVPPIVTDGLQLYLDAKTYVGSGSTWTSNLGSDATLYNSPAYTSANPTYFDFTPSSLQYGTVPTLGDLSSWTVEAWFRPTADLSLASLTSVVSTVFDDPGVSHPGLINFALTNYDGTSSTPNNGIRTGFYNGAWHLTDLLTTTPGTWYSVTGTYNGIYLKQYNNGTLGSSVTVGTASGANNGDIRIARRWDGGVESQWIFPGDIAIIRIYNIAFDDAQVTQNFLATRGRFGL